MHVTTRVLHEDAGHSVTGRTESLYFDPLVQDGFVQLSQEDAVRVWIRCKDFNWLSRGLGYNNKNISFVKRRGGCGEILGGPSRER